MQNISNTSISVPPRYWSMTVVADREVHGGVPWHTSVRSTLPLSVTPVPSDTASSVKLTGAGTRVHGDGLADDEAIGDQLADGLAGVGVRDFVDFIGVEPDLALSASNDGRREALLSTEIDPVLITLSVCCS